MDKNYSVMIGNRFQIFSESGEKDIDNLEKKIQGSGAAKKKKAKKPREPSESESTENTQTEKKTKKPETSKQNEVPKKKDEPKPQTSKKVEKEKPDPSSSVKPAESPVPQVEKPTQQGRDNKTAGNRGVGGTRGGGVDKPALAKDDQMNEKNTRFTERSDRGGFNDRGNRRGGGFRGNNRFGGGSNRDDDGGNRERDGGSRFGGGRGRFNDNRNDDEGRSGGGYRGNRFGGNRDDDGEGRPPRRGGGGGGGPRDFQRRPRFQENNNQDESSDKEWSSNKFDGGSSTSRFDNEWSSYPKSDQQQIDENEVPPTIDEFRVDTGVDRSDRPDRGRGRGRGGRWGRGGRGGGNFFNTGKDFRGKREHDRHSGMEKSSFKQPEKREGTGARNWGDPVKDQEYAENDVSAAMTADDSTIDWGVPADPETNPEETKENVAEPGEAVEDADTSLDNEKMQSEREMTLDEWKELQKDKKPKADFNLRRPGEGEEGSQWDKGFELRKKEVADDGPLYERATKTSGRVRQTVEIEIKFGDQPRRGSRGRGGGRGRGGRGGNFRSDGGPEAGSSRGGFSSAPRGGLGASPSGRSTRFKSDDDNSETLIRVDDESDFPSLM